MNYNTFHHIHRENHNTRTLTIPIPLHISSRNLSKIWPTFKRNLHKITSRPNLPSEWWCPIVYIIARCCVYVSFCYLQDENVEKCINHSLSAETVSPFRICFSGASNAYPKQFEHLNYINHDFGCLSDKPNYVCHRKKLSVSSFCSKSYLSASLVFAIAYSKLCMIGLSNLSSSRKTQPNIC